MKCEHQNLTFTLTPELTHYGKETCADCGAFVRWKKKPETEARESRYGSAIVLLRDDSRLTAWERDFVQSLNEKGPRFSPKQQVVLERLIGRFLQ